MDEQPGVPEVRPPTIDDIRRICRALEEAGARYVLIGDFAAILHGGLRTTKDIDLLVDPEPANVELLKRALSILEDDAAREIEPGDLQKYSVVRVADEVLVNPLAAACGVTWSEAQSSAVRMDLEGTPVIVADIETLNKDEEDPQAVGCRRLRLARVAPGRRGAVGPTLLAARSTSSGERFDAAATRWRPRRIPVTCGP